MCISYCSGVRCLCASCVNEVNNLRVDIGELREPCFHCEDNCYVYDHNELKKVRNRSCRARCTGSGKEGNASQCTFHTTKGSSLPYPWRPASSPPKVPVWMNREECPEFIVAIKFAEEATTLKYRPDIGWFADNNTYTVTAWCPLPELP